MSVSINAGVAQVESTGKALSSLKASWNPYRERQNAQGKSYYESLEVAIDDLPARQEAAARNYRFFDAPHAAFLFMPSFGDNVRVAADIGMYAQSFLLALARRGVGSIPQTSLGFFADVVRDVLGVPAEFKLLFGISFGYHDDAAKGNTERPSTLTKIDPFVLTKMNPRSAQCLVPMI